MKGLRATPGPGRQSSVGVNVIERRTGHRACAALPDVWGYLTIGLSLLVGTILLYAAYVKIRAPWEEFAMSIAAYGLLPESAVYAVARALPWLELVLGVLLVTGYALRYAALAVTGLLSMFFCVMLLAFAKGLTIDCGCFGAGEVLGRHTLVRDGGLLAASAVLTCLCFRTRPKRKSNVHNAPYTVVKETGNDTTTD